MYYRASVRIIDCLVLSWDFEFIVGIVFVEEDVLYEVHHINIVDSKKSKPWGGNQFD